MCFINIYFFILKCLRFRFFVNLHKSNSIDLNEAIKKYKKIGILTSGKNACKTFFSNIKKEILKGKKLFLLENLSYKNEKINEFSFEELINHTAYALNILIIIDEMEYNL